MKKLFLTISDRFFYRGVVSKLGVFILTAVLSYSTGASADDTELFFSSQSGQPNILFILDDSGSMGEITNGQTRMAQLQSALTNILNGLSGVNAGIFRFNSEVQLEEPIDSVDDFDHKQDLLNAVAALGTNGGTGTQRALWAARSYYRGELFSPFGQAYPTPVTHECQQNHIILMTDGQPSASVNIAPTIEANLGVTCDAATVSEPGDGDCGAELGQHLFDAPVVNRFPNSNIITHTIGFDFDHPWLASLSGNTLDADGNYTGGYGMHFTVDSSSELLSAFQTIVGDVGTTFAAPRVSVNAFNESRHRNELFYAQFQSTSSARWNGNIKKYKLSEITDADTGDSETVIVDADNEPLLDDEGLISPTSRSLWSDVDDGESIAQGGFAYELPDYSDRQWYTDYNSTTPFKVTDSTKNLLPAASIGAVDDDERDTLVSWALGFDVEGQADPDSDGNHYFVADSLHNSPTLLSYWAKSDPLARGEVLFASNNLGVLHAINPATGTELWSYTPEEHLDNIKGYFDNEVTEDHIYGLDGEITLHTVRENREDYDFWVEDAWLYMTERRGGNRVYALDVSDGLTDPETSDPFSVLWKITGGIIPTPVYDKDGDGRSDYADLAQTWSKPEMVTVSVNCPDNCESKELLMFSGGYNAAIYDNVDLEYDSITVPANSHGNAVYFVDPETGDLEWSVGNGAHHSLDLSSTGMNHSIPSTPVPFDRDLDGSIDLMFFIDVGGDVWRVDFGNDATSLDEIHIAGGKIAELSPAGQSLRFFNPIDVVVSGTNYSTSYFSLVTGSGMRTSPLYQEPNRNRLYTIKDRWVHQVPYRLNANDVKEYNYEYVTSSTGNHSVITADDDILKNVSDADSTTSLEYGFFKTFALGEKILQPTLVHSNRIFANSYVPPELGGGSDCNYDYGTTRLYITNLSDGENALSDGFGDYVTVGDGLLSGGQIIDTGQGDAPFFLVDKNVFTLKDLIAPDDAEVFRKFRRTGWVELDGY